MPPSRASLPALRTLICAIALTWLSACQPTRQPPLADGTQQAPLLLKVDRWRAEGKLSLSYAGERDTASFDWRQNKQDYTLHLFGPLGQGSTRLKRKGETVTLESAKTGRQTAQSAEHLMLANLGWQVPVSNMQYWIRGLVAPSPPPTATQTNDSAHLAKLRQEGWQVDYQRYETFNGWHLPTKLIAERDDIRIRLIIKQWSLPKAPFNGVHP